MVMKPEPWGEALDAARARTAPRSSCPTPAGEPFTQALAAELATREHLVFACGRYEGIDQRVLDEAADRLEVREVSLGDYVLNGGEVAALAIIEAVVRLLPGFMGNAESLAEESHADGLLEYPVFTKPATWRGRRVPDVLLSGDHARIAAWRHAESVRRTAERRPDLAHPAQAVDLAGLSRRGPAGRPLRRRGAAHPPAGLLGAGAARQPRRPDPGAARGARRRAGVDGGVDHPGAALGGRLVGAARGRQEGDQWDVGRVMAAPDLQGRGLGRLLLRGCEEAAPADVTGFVLFTGAGSQRNIRIYKKAGYRRLPGDSGVPGAVRLGKRRR